MRPIEASLPNAPYVPAAAPTPAPRAQQPSAGAVSGMPIEEAVAAAAQAVRSLSSDIEITLDRQSGRPIVRVMDGYTGELIRQIPSEEMLEIARALDRLHGLLIHQKA